MTYKEAIPYIKSDMSGCYGTPQFFEAHYKAIEALEKQIPKKALKEIELDGQRAVGAFCPNCSGVLVAGNFYLGRCKCGQKLDGWELV